MTLEFKKGIKKGKEVCIISTEKIKTVEYPIWLTEENFHKIKQLMQWYGE